MSRTKVCFNPRSTVPFAISRTGLELFSSCPRCFYFDKRLGCARPPSLPFTLNNAVDALLKREFDDYRGRRTPHPLMIGAGINALPFLHSDLDKWRDVRRGIRFLHAASGFDVYGAVDDVWQHAGGDLIIVDYKATAKIAEVAELKEPWHDAFKRQIAIYQWLFRRNGFPVSATAYWVYANGDVTAARFDQMLRFRMTVIPYTCSDDWVEPRIMAARACLMNNSPPPPAGDCKYCSFAEGRSNNAAQ
jgi:RecB family exonuclease